MLDVDADVIPTGFVLPLLLILEVDGELLPLPLVIDFWGGESKKSDCQLMFIVI